MYANALFRTLVFGTGWILAGAAFTGGTASAGDYALDPSTSFARFHLQSGIAELAGELHDYDAMLRVLSTSPLRLQVDATADLRSLKLDGAEGMQSLTGTLARGVSDPEMRISGVVAKAPKSGACTFSGTVRRGKQERRMRLTCKILQANNEAIVVVTKVTTPLSEITDDLPFRLPVTDGEAEANGRFRFVAAEAKGPGRE